MEKDDVKVSATSGGQKKKVRKTRAWSAIVYPDSAPEGWRDALEETHVPALISPLHDGDVNPDGEPKKPHYHVVVIFDGPATEGQAKEILVPCGAANGVVQAVSSLTGQARYLCHLDNPEKAQYSAQDVRELSGADYEKYINRLSDRNGAIIEMMDFVEKYQVKSFATLARYAADTNKLWFHHLTTDCGWYMKEYIKSSAWSNLRNEVRITDPETGEIIYEKGEKND